MGIYERLQKASFNNVEFLVKEARDPGGNNVVVHNFPNSNNQYVEVINTPPKTFTLTIVIGEKIEDGSRSDALTERKAIEGALSTGRAHTLVHPIYGHIDNVIAGKYDIGYSQSNLGIFDLTVPFYIHSDVVIQPAAEDTSSESVETQVEKTLDTTYDAVETKLDEVEYTDKKNGKSLYDKVKDFTDNLGNSIKNIINPIQKKVGEYNKLVNRITNTGVSIMADASSVKGLISSVLLAYRNITSLPEELLKSWESLIDFGSSASETVFPAKNNPKAITTVPTEYNTVIKTKEQQTESQIKNIIDDTAKIAALVGLYEVGASTDFTNDEELVEFKANIEAQFQYIVNDSPDIMENSILHVKEVRDELFKLRSAVVDNMNEKLVNLWKIDEKRVGLSTVFLESYRFYGNIDNIEELKGLNRGLSHSGSRDDMRILV